MYRSKLSLLGLVALVVLLAALSAVLAVVLTGAHSGAVNAQSQSGKGNRVTSEEFSFHSDNADQFGIWSDGETVWISDGEDRKFYAYNFTSKARVSGEDRTVSFVPKGFHVVGSTAYVAHNPGVLTLGPSAGRSGRFCTFFGSGTTSSQLSCTDVALQGGHDRRGQHPHPRGVWAGGGVVYISDGSGDTSGLINHHHDGGSVYAYNTNGTPNTDKNFGAVNGDGVESITGLWSDGVTMWMVSFDANKVFAYKLSDRSRDSGKDFTLHSDNGDPQGIWSDGVHMWVVDSADNKAYAYDISALTTPSNKLAPYTGSVLGLHADQDRILVGDPGSNRVRTYHVDTRYPQQRFDTRLNTGQGNTNLGGIWYNEDSKVLYVADNGPSKRIYAYKDGSWDSRYDIPSLLDVGRISGIWSDGEVMWIVDAQNKRVSAYHLISPGNTRVRKASEHNIALPESMESPYGAHSDGTILWIADDKTSGDKLYAFRLSDGVRLPGKDINLWSSNQKPRGVSSEGAGRLLVVDGGDGAAFHVYGVPEMPVFEVTLGTTEVREGGGTQTIPVTVSVKDASGAALTNAVEYRIGLGEITASGNVTFRESRTGDFFLPSSPDQTTTHHARYLATISLPVGTMQRTTQLRVEILDDDIVEGTEYFAVVVEGDGTYSPFNYIDRFEGYERVAILDNDGDPCAPILANRPLTLGGEQFLGDEVTESVSTTGTGSGEGDHRGEITRSSCRTPDHLRENTRYQAHLFQVPELALGEHFSRFVVHPDLDEDRCNRQGLCAESFDPYLILFRGEDIDDAELIGEFDDIDASTGNVSAAAVIPVRGGDKIIALVTTYSQGVGYTQGTGYYPEGVGYTLRYDFSDTESELYPLPPLRPGVLWTEPVAPDAGKPDDADDGPADDTAAAVSLAVSAQGLVTWDREEPQVPGQVYLLRWVSGESPPQSADSMDAPGYGNGWVGETDCGEETCEFRIADFDPDRHYLVEVRSLLGDAEWEEVRHTPAVPATPPPEPEDPSDPGLVISVVADDPRALDVSWNPLGDTFHYRVRATPDGFFETTELVRGVTELRLTGLETGTTYAIKVEAFTDDGIVVYAVGQGTPGAEPAAPPSEEPATAQDVIDDVWGYARETEKGYDHVLRWMRVLKTLDAVEDMTAAQAQGYADNGWARWDPVVVELEKLEAAPGAYEPDQDVVANVRSYAQETQQGFDHVLRWMRVLKTFGAIADMTSSEAQGYADNGWARWDPVVEALKEKV